MIQTNSIYTLIKYNNFNYLAIQLTLLLIYMNVIINTIYFKIINFIFCNYFIFQFQFNSIQYNKILF